MIWVHVNALFKIFTVERGRIMQFKFKEWSLGGKASSIMAIALGASLLGSISMDDLGNTINAGGIGLYIYITASIILNIGTIIDYVMGEKVSDKRNKLQ